LAVSPSAFLQKLGVNIFGRYGWNHAGTDDATGKTWGFSLFKRRFKVPRVVDWKLRLGLSIICIAAFIIISAIKQTKADHHKREIALTEAPRA
jgi:hypothetical protein